MSRGVATNRWQTATYCDTLLCTKSCEMRQAAAKCDQLCPSSSCDDLWRITPHHIFRQQMEENELPDTLTPWCPKHMFLFYGSLLSCHQATHGDRQQRQATSYNGLLQTTTDLSELRPTNSSHYGKPKQISAPPNKLP